MQTLLTIIMIITGIFLIGSILLMSPKGGLGMGIGGMSNAGEYGSKKTLEHKLKRTATIAAIIFVISAVTLPYTLG